MKINLKRTAIAVAVAALAASPAAFAQSVDDQNASADIQHNHVVVEDWDIAVDDIRNFDTTNTVTNTATNTTTNTLVDSQDWDVTVDDTRNYETNVENRNYNQNVDVNATVDADVDLVLDAAAVVRYNGEFNERSNDRTHSWTTTESHDYTSDIDTTESHAYASTSAIDTTETHAYSSTWDVTATEDVDIDSEIRREQNEHGRSVYLSKDLSVSSDVSFSGEPTITGDIDLDSAAIAVVDGRQTIAENDGDNDILDNTASIADDAGGGASGNLGFNVAAGDNNAQDNAAALSAADASFAFGMADAEIFNSQIGAANTTDNAGVANDANLGGAAFSGASGNININVASGNNNAQRNSLAASVATSAYAQASVASDQVSTGNFTANAGSMEDVTDTVTFTLGGTMSGADGSAASYEGRGAAYQMGNIYPELWGADSNDGNHISSPRLGHVDMDGDMQGSIDNPYRESDEFGEIGGIAFDTDEAGTIDLSDMELDAALTGTVDLSYQVAV